MALKFKINNSFIAYNDNQSDNQPMVFIHGLPTSKELFAPVLSEFEDNFRVVAIDLLDYGESSKIERHIEHKERAQNIHYFFKELNLKNIILVSHDLGSSVAIDIMDVCSELIDKVVIMSPPVYPDFREPFVVKLVRSRLIGPILIALMKNYLLARSIKKGLYNKENYNVHLKKYLEKAFKGRYGSAALLRNLRWGRPKVVFVNYPKIIKSISQNVLVIQGKVDPYIPIEHAKRLVSDIKNSKLVLLENAGHFLPIDVPDIISKVIKEFVESKAE